MMGNSRKSLSVKFVGLLIMRVKFLQLFVLSFAIVGCDDSSQEVQGKKDGQEAYVSMQQLIEQGGGYDIANVSELIVGDSGYWQLDAVLGYDENFKSVETVYRDFTKAGEQQANEPIFAFCVDGRVLCYEIDQSEWRIKEQVGSWDFAPRTLVFRLAIPNVGNNEEKTFTLLALTGSAIVLEWISSTGEAMRLSLRSASLRDMQLRSANGAINALMATSLDFDSEELVQGLPGEWVEDSYLEYDQEWEHIIEPYKIMGVAYCEGGGLCQYLFEAGGKGSKLFVSIDPSMMPETTLFEWRYDRNSEELLLQGDEFNASYFVSGYNGNYITLDQESAGRNFRLILKHRMP